MNSSASRTVVWISFVVLFFLHQDVWFWGDTTLVFGFLPIGLAYHALFSIMSACLWAAAVRWAWPTEIEAWAAQSVDDGGDI